MGGPLKRVWWNHVHVVNEMTREKTDSAADAMSRIPQSEGDLCHLTRENAKCRQIDSMSAPNVRQDDHFMR